MANAAALPDATLAAPASPAHFTVASKLDAGNTKIFEVAAELRRLEAAAERQLARRAAGEPLCDSDEVPASHEASRGPALRRQLMALTPAGAVWRRARSASKATYATRALCRR